VVDQGLGGLTVRNVATRLGLTATALYRHYRSKADILSSVLDLVGDLDAENLRLAKAESGTPLATLRNLLLRNIEFMQRYPALPILYLSDLLWHEEPRLAERVRDDIAKERAAVVEIIRQGQDSGQIRDDLDPDCLCNTFIGLYVMPALMLSRPIGEFDVAKQAEINWRLFAEAVAR
jgi:AcrR family transcriptional regulator